MRTFEYRGYNQAGQSDRGLIEALDIKEAREKLAHRGVLAESVQAAGTASRWVWRRRDVLFTLDTRAAFYRELASILSAGIPLTGALSLLLDAPEMGGNRSVIAGVRDRLEEGLPLADGLARGSGNVTAFEQAVIHTGEQSGRLEEVLDRLADYLEEERRLRDRLISALIYPLVILTLSVIVGVAMLTFMLPAFREVLLESGVDLPWITRAFMGMAQGAAWGLPVLAGAALVAGTWFRSRWRASEGFRSAFDRRLFTLPLYRSFYAVWVALRFSRTLGMLLKSRLPLLSALSQSGRACGSPWVAQRVEEEAEAVRHGLSLSDAIARIPPLAGSLTGWLRAGEAGGNLSEMLDHAAARLQQVWERNITRTMTLFESLLVVLVGIGVFLLALSIILPILSLNQLLQ